MLENFVIFFSLSFPFSFTNLVEERVNILFYFLLGEKKHAVNKVLLVVFLTILISFLHYYILIMPL